MYNPFKLVVRCFTSCFYIKFQNKCYFTLKKPIISSVKQLHVVEEHRNKRLVLQVELLGRTLGKCAVLTGAALLMTEPALLLCFFFQAVGALGWSRCAGGEDPAWDHIASFLP